MRILPIPVILLVGLAGCTGQSAVKPVEVLDDRSAVTVGALKEPIEFVPNSQNTALVSRKRTTFAYLGPVEWDRSGAISYNLWVHIAPGNDRPAGDIRAPAALVLNLDDGPLTLVPAETPKLGRDPYQQVVSWGQAAYFDLSVDALKRMAASRKLELDVRAADGSSISFSPTLDAHAALTRYLQARGISGQ